MIKEWEELNAKATKGKWEIYTSCSWLRIGSAVTYKEILYPIKSASDGHPDMGGVNVTNDLKLIVFLRNHSEALLELVKAAKEEHPHEHDTNCRLCNAFRSLARINKA